MTRQLPRLHAVTNDDVLALPDFTDRAARIAVESDGVVHVRSGSVGGRKLSELGDSAISSCGANRVFINDRADVANAVGAAGVHLPSGGLPAAAVREIVGPDCWIGRSTHGVDDVARAAGEGVDYVFLGPIFPTSSHPGTEPLGPGVLGVQTRMPVIAIGGVTPENAAECIASGAYGVAVISSLWYVKDAISAVQEFSLSFPP